MNEIPSISIITAAFNNVLSIERTIQSIINQSFPNIQYIIIDGGSKDGTLAIIEKYKSRIDYFCSEPDQGIYDAWNKGILASHGDIIGFLNADDYFTSADSIKRLVEIYQNVAHQSHFIISGGMNKIDHEGNLLFSIKASKSFFDKKINYINALNHPSTFVTKTTYDKIGCFDISYKIAGDYDFILRARYSNIEFLFVDDVFVNMSVGGISEKPVNIIKVAKEKFKARRKYLGDFKNFIFCLTWVISWEIKYIVKLLLSKKILNIYYNLRHSKRNYNVN